MDELNNLDFKIGDNVGFYTFSGYKVGKVKDIKNSLSKIDIDVYVVDETGAHTMSIPHFNIVAVIQEQQEKSLEDIKKPARYNKRGTLECWDVIIDQEMNFLEGNVLKYLWRYKEKGGLEDLKKAKIYLEKLILENSK